MARTQDIELYDEALFDATRAQFAALVADLAADGEVVDLAAPNKFLWEIAEENAEAELAQRKRDAIEYA